MEAVRVLNELLARPTHEGVLEGALSHASFLLGGNLRGYAVTHRAQGQDRVTAVFGYPKALVGTPLSGPWAALRTRVLSDGSRELYEANPPELHGVLDTCGMRDVALSLVVPVNDRGRNMGALVLDRNTSEDIGLAAQELVTRWATAVAPLLGLLESRENWRLTARQVSSGVVEALESQEFDALGHGQAVAEASVKLGRAVGLAERELEELWFAATLHDLGKIHGEKGHAQVGANFLHGVPHMVQRRRPSATTTSAGTVRANPTNWPERTSRCTPASWPSPTPTCGWAISSGCAGRQARDWTPSGGPAGKGQHRAICKMSGPLNPGQFKRCAPSGGPLR